MLDVAAERGSIELVDELAFPVPFQVISDLLDMPQTAPTSSASGASSSPRHSSRRHDRDLDAGEAAIVQLIPYLVEVIDARRQNLGDDLLSGLLVGRGEPATR